jgi:hypothetical protein
MSMKVIPPVPPLPESGEDAACGSAADAREAMQDLASLLAEFSGESMDYLRVPRLAWRPRCRRRRWRA